MNPLIQKGALKCKKRNKGKRYFFWVTLNPLIQKRAPKVWEKIYRTGKRYIFGVALNHLIQKGAQKCRERKKR